MSILKSLKLAAAAPVNPASSENGFRTKLRTPPARAALRG